MLKKDLWWEKNFKRTGDFAIQAKLALMWEFPSFLITLLSKLFAT